MNRRCPYLEYRRDGDDRSFDHERPYCLAVDGFVQPMRADVCAGRHRLDFAAHCEYYREHAGVDPLDALSCPPADALSYPPTDAGSPDPNDPSQP